MAIRDVKDALEATLPKETRELKDGEVQVTVRAGNATVTLSVYDNQVTVATARSPGAKPAIVEAITDRVSHTHLLSSDEEAFDSAVMVVSQINEA
ncbi:hypothetical protein ACCS75_29815 [Rhizobium ruizarguesonis]